MADSLQRILADAKAGKFSSISALSEDDVANVWENVATYIEQKMGTQKGVHIPNFGTFSFSQNKLDVGNNKYVMMQRPVFNISEKFAQTHGLQFTKYNVPGLHLQGLRGCHVLLPVCGLPDVPRVGQHGPVDPPVSPPQSVSVCIYPTAVAA